MFGSGCSCFVVFVLGIGFLLLAVVIAARGGLVAGLCCLHLLLSPLSQLRRDLDLARQVFSDWQRRFTEVFHADFLLSDAMRPECFDASYPLSRLMLCPECEHVCKV